MESIIQLHNMDPINLVEIIKSILKEELGQLLLHLKKLNNDEYLTRKQTAKFLQVSETTLWNLDRKQILPARRLNGRVLYLKSDLFTFLEKAA